MKKQLRHIIVFVDEETAQTTRRIICECEEFENSLLRKPMKEEAHEILMKSQGEFV